MTQIEKAHYFASLHKAGDPLILYNIWDAGSAQVIEKAGANALATGSWSVAAAQGYADGEALPLDFLVQIAARIAASVDVPLSIDFEGGYGVATDVLVRNVARIIETGAIGINFEDQVVGGEGLHPPDVQANRIEAARLTGEHAHMPLFINARTDLFLKEKDVTKHASLMPQAKSRAKLYQQAGANGYFVPGLVDQSLIAEMCASTDLPVNVLKKDTSPSLAQLAAAGVARISYGPCPYFAAMEDLKNRFMGLA
ncbi:MAG: phosphonomutase [Hyphomicrobiales bacterium]|nr:MAG: phosphonomutase [Hyphomicrobiales bacterium]